MAGLNFNANEVAPNQAFENLTPGWYTVKMTESEMKPTKTSGGAYLQCEFEVIAPAQFAGRKLWDRLNLQNSNQVAVDIAMQTLSAMCHATGVMQVQDSQQLHNIPMDAKVGMTKPTEDYPEIRNEIKGYRACQGASGAQAPAPQQQFAQQAQQQAPQQQFQQQAPQQQFQQQAPAQQFQQAPQQQQAQQFQQAPQQQGAQQPWATGQAQQGAAPAQQQAPQQQQAAPAQQQQFEQNPAGQQAASQGAAPWQTQQ